MLSQEIPDNQWQTVATDLFTWNSDTYIVICDYLSRYFEIKCLHNTTISAVIHKMKGVFARHGIPEKVRPCYNSRDFSQFAKRWGFQHITSSPCYPQSNGIAEKTVQTAKRILTKAREDGKDPYLEFLEYRNFRRLRSILSSEDCASQKKGLPKPYDKTARPLPTLLPGASVYFQREDGRWQPATVTGPAETPQSYHIKTSDGQDFIRNRRHLSTGKHTSTEPTAIRTHSGKKEMIHHF
uniref:Integrase catalytic domain-containing protein n=1 Tax=Amphilophus citrinellus TaxID=61819 RepID=A0A3Q0QWP2_AMPCI